MHTAQIVERHPRMRVGQAIAVYVWQYPLRLVHWGLVLCIGVLSFTGYFIHNPFIVGQTSARFMMGWFRFVHESFGMAFIAFFLLRLCLFFAGDRWVRWQACQSASRTWSRRKGLRPHRDRSSIKTTCQPKMMWWSNA